MELVFTFCDVCNLECSFTTEEGRGYILYPLQIAVNDFGWEIRDGKHICSSCLGEENEIKTTRN